MEIIYFGIGLIVASFLNAQVYRIQNGYALKKLLFTRSACENCNKELVLYELIPVISWIFQRGRCGKCKTNISIYYPISELLLGISFVIVAQSTNPILYMTVLIFLFLLSYFDYLSKTIPALLTNILVAISIVYFAFNFSFDNGFPFFILLMLFILIYRLVRYRNSKEIFGFGDVLILFAISLIFNQAQYISFLLLSAYIPGAYAIYLIIKDRDNINAYIPLVPFISLAYVLSFIINFNFLIFR